MILYEWSFYKYLRTVYMSFLNKNNNQNYSAYVEFMLYISSSSLSALLLLLEPPIDLDPSCSCFFAVCLLHPQQQERGKSSIEEEESIHTTSWNWKVFEVRDLQGIYFEVWLQWCYTRQMIAVAPTEKISKKTRLPLQQGWPAVAPRLDDKWPGSDAW